VVSLLNVNNAQNTFCLHFYTLADTLSNCFVSQLPAINLIECQLCNHKHEDDFSIHWQRYR